MSAPPPPSGVVSSREKRASDVTDQHRYRYEMVRAATRRGADHQHRPAHHRVRRPGLRPARHGAGARPSSPGPRSTRPWSPAGARASRSPSRRRRTRSPPAPASAPSGTRTRCRPRPPAGPRSGSPRPVRRVHPAGAANAITVRYSIPDAPTGGGITAPLYVTGTGLPPDDDADLPVRLAVQPVSVLQRPERRPAAPGPVHHRVRVRPEGHRAGPDDHQAVPPQPLLRRAAAAARPDAAGRGTSG